MFRNIIFIIAFLALFFGPNSYARDDDCGREPVVGAVADLRCWDGISKIPLSGQWHIDYKAHHEDINFNGLIDVPLRWREMESPLPFAARAVYRIKILLPQPMDTLGLKLPANYVAKKAVLIDRAGNETLLFDTGKTDLIENVIFDMRTPIIHLPKLGIESELVIHINNSETTNAGLELAPVLGVASDLIRHDQIVRNITMLISTVLLVFFVLNLYLWLARGREWSLLALSMITFLVALRQIAASGILYDFVPGLSISVDSAIGWTTYLAGILFGFSFFRAMYPNLIPKWLATIIYASVILGFIIFITQPLSTMQAYGRSFNLITLFSVSVMIGYFIKGMVRSNKEMRLTIISGASMLCGFAADVLYYHLLGFNPVVPLTAIGMLVFVATQSVIISQRYNESLRKSAQLSQELQTLNTSLGEKVAKRTKELAYKNQLLEEMARTDVLTGLANRRSFEEVMRHEIGRSLRNDKKFVIGIIDLDKFKAVNDKYGHEAGDIVLQGIATILKDGLRVADYPFRWGGDEFCIMFPETDGNVALVIAERIKKTIEMNSFSFEGQDLAVTASIGLAIWQKGRNVESVIKEADKAMYESKNHGCNKVTAWWHLPQKTVKVR